MKVAALIIVSVGAIGLCYSQNTAKLGCADATKEFNRLNDSGVVYTKKKFYITANSYFKAAEQVKQQHDSCTISNLEASNIAVSIVAPATYQKLIERLNWIENRQTTLEGDNIVSGKIAGCVVLGHNWNSENILENQMQVYRWFGFEVPRECSFNWQWTSDVTDESAEGYKQDPIDFAGDFKLNRLTESFNKWNKK